MWRWNSDHIGVIYMLSPAKGWNTQSSVGAEGRQVAGKLSELFGKTEPKGI